MCSETIPSFTKDITRAKVEVKMVDIPTVVQEKRVVLEITETEAQVLFYLLRNVGGDPDTTDRKYIAPIEHALGAAGFNTRRSILEGYASSIYFK